MEEFIFYDKSISNSYVLFQEDCLETSRKLEAASVDLIYADPPFFTDKVHSSHDCAFDDRWNEVSEYLEWIKPRLLEFRRILKSSGTIFIHCDWHVSHYLKALADSVFGRRNFLNEIIWKRQSSHNDVRQGSRHFGRIHDTIFVYVMSSKYVWNQQFTPYDESYLKNTYKHVESETNRRYALGDLTAPGGAAKGNARYEFLGVERYWRYGKVKMFELLFQGKISYMTGRVPLLKRYLDEVKGKPIQDIWTDINPECNRRIVYPTQKPEALLSRIISTSTNPNQIVYDPFTGSGTSGVVCFRLSRKWIGSEISSKACLISVNRFKALGCGVDFYSNEYSKPPSSTVIPLLLTTNSRGRKENGTD